MNLITSKVSWDHRTGENEKKTHRKVSVQTSSACGENGSKLHEERTFKSKFAGVINDVSKELTGPNTIFSFIFGINQQIDELTFAYHYDFEK